MRLKFVQGIKGSDRAAIVDTHSTLVFDINGKYQAPNADEIESMFQLFLSEFYSAVPRKWLSATSKLLWCSYPDHVVIYDSFVERALMVLQGITPYLSELPRIKSCPAIKSVDDIKPAIDFYMNYQNMVMAILSEHKGQFHELRLKSNETYPHDIRIIDKLLWMLGNPNREIILQY